MTVYGSIRLFNTPSYFDTTKTLQCEWTCRCRLFFTPFFLEQDHDAGLYFTKNDFSELNALTRITVSLRSVLREVRVTYWSGMIRKIRGSGSLLSLNNIRKGRGGRKQECHIFKLYSFWLQTYEGVVYDPGIY